MPTVSRQIEPDYRLDVQIDVLSQNIANNSTDIRWTLILVKTGNWAASTAGSWSVNINGGGASGNVSYDFRNYNSLTLGTGTATVGHNSDGTKSMYVGGSFSDRLGYITGGSVEGWVALPTIPRKTFPNISKSGWATGETLTVNLNPASSTFTHELQIHIGNVSETIVGRTSATTLTWPIRHDLIAQFPNASNGTATVRLLTFSGSTYLGYTDNWIAIKPAASQVPSFTSAVFEEANAKVISAAVGAYVQGVSNLSYTFTGATGIYGSSITRYEVTVGSLTGTNVTGQSTTASGTTPPIPASGTVPVRATITDSRGMKAYKDYTLSGVRAYTPPKITANAATRSNGAGAAQDSGDYAILSLTANVTSLVVGTQKNRSRYSIETRLTGSTGSWTPRISTAFSTATSIDTAPNYGVFDVAKSYDVRFTVEDVFGNKDVKTSNIPIATVFMHWATNKGMGVGKFWSKGSIDAMEEIYQNNGQAVLSVQEPVVLVSESNTATQSITNGQSWTRNLPSITVTKPTLVRAWIFGTWDASSNAAFNIFAVRNNSDILTVPSHTHHSLGSSGIFAYYFEYKVLLQPGTHTLGFRFGVHTGGASLRIRNSNVAIEKIGD